MKDSHVTPTVRTLLRKVANASDFDFKPIAKGQTQNLLLLKIQLENQQRLSKNIKYDYIVV